MGNNKSNQKIIKTVSLVPLGITYLESTHRYASDLENTR